MIIQLKKFGTTLVSRPSGKEALLAFNPNLDELKKDEEVIVDFSGVIVLTPSWADEFLIPLIERFDKQVQFMNTDNPSVKASLSILSQQHGVDYNSYTPLRVAGISARS